MESAAGLDGVVRGGTKVALREPGAAAPLAKVTGMIVTVRVRCAPQGGGGVQSTPVSARAAEILRGLRGLEASFMRK